MKNMMPEYVEELEAYDVDMLEHNLEKNAKDYKTDSIKEALEVILGLLDRTLKKIGVDVSGSEETIDSEMEKHDVKVEHRKNYCDDETWRNGIYVYKGMDLTGFISEPLVKRTSVFELDRTPYVVVRAALQ